MTPEASKPVMIRFTEFINTASEALAAELISPDAIFHVPGRREPMRGPAGYLAIIQMIQALNIYRLSRQKIIEETGQPDLFGLLQQIGAVPAK
jgi:hypothetical protein